MSNLCVTASVSVVDDLRSVLKELELNDPSRRLKFLSDDNLIAIPIKHPVSTTQLDSSTQLDLDTLEKTISSHMKYNFANSKLCIRHLTLPNAKKFDLKCPQQLLKEQLQKLVERNGYSWTIDVSRDVPRHWERHGDLVLIPSTAFALPIWTDIGIEVWKTAVQCLSCSRLAQKCPVSVDAYRTPQVNMLYGSNTWVEHTDNAIRYTYDVTKCMFSAGNITEKLRVAKLQCDGEVVVDLYAGIGYFALPYLVYTGVKHLHACEWNLNAVEALHRNLIINGVNDRCTVHLGDNRKMCPRGIADRVNLGLIPSSREGWPVACAALKPGSGGVLHIHYNVNTKPQTGNQHNGGVEPRQLFRHEAKSQKNSEDSHVETDEEGVKCNEVNHGIEGSKTEQCDVLSVVCAPSKDSGVRGTGNERCVIEKEGRVRHVKKQECLMEGVKEVCVMDRANMLEYVTSVDSDRGVMDKDSSNHATSDEAVIGTPKHDYNDYPTTSKIYCRKGFKACKQDISNNTVVFSETEKQAKTEDNVVLSEGEKQDKCDDIIVFSETEKQATSEDAVVLNESKIQAKSEDAVVLSDGKIQVRSEDAVVLSEGKIHVQANSEDAVVQLVLSDGKIEDKCENIVVLSEAETLPGPGCCDMRHCTAYSKWYSWACQTSGEIRDILQNIHNNAWTIDIVHIEHVKSYAPYIDHIVLDLKCKPHG